MDKCEHEWVLENDGWVFTLSICKKCGATLEEDSYGSRILPPKGDSNDFQSGERS